MSVAAFFPIVSRFRPLPGLLVLFFAGSFLLASAEASERKETVVVLDSPEIEELLDTLGKPLVKAAGLPADSVQFHIILNSQINAMALPNGHLVFNSGLVDQCQSPEELASVMAHETAHLAAGHHVRLQKEMRSVSIQALLATVAGLAAGVASGNNRITEAAMVGSSAAAQSMMLDSMREKESQADRLAIHYLAKTGTNPESMAIFLRHLLGEQRKASMPAPYLLTHPLSAERVLDAERTASVVRTTTNSAAPVAPESLRRVQAFLIAASETDPRKAETLLQNRLKTRPDDISARYGLAMVHRYAGETKKALADIDALLATHPRDPWFLREKGLLLLDEGKPALAEEVFLQALELKPDNPDLRYRLAVSFSEGGKRDAAARSLRRLTVEKPMVPNYQYQLGLVEGQRERLGPAHLAMARHHALLMDEKMTLFHYRAALDHFTRADQEYDIARTELKRFEDEQKKIRSSR
ncbi:MAG: M48 family metalloprotease [Magnetococcales bacterium]|nr:M48 family metalloprotease [Magnetococcales bacterium]